MLNAHSLLVRIYANAYTEFNFNKNVNFGKYLYAVSTHKPLKYPIYLSR